MDKQYSNAPIGSAQRTSDLLKASKDMLASANIDSSGFDRTKDLYNIGRRSANGFNATNPVPTSTLTSSRKPEVPAMPTTATAQNNLGVTASNVMNAPIPTPQQTQSASLLDTLKKSIGMQAKQGEETLKAQKEQDIEGKIKAVTDITNEAITVGKSYDDKLKELEKNPQGLYGGALSDAMDSLRRKKNEELANIGIRQQVAQNNLEGARRIVDDKIKAKFEPIDNQIKSLTQLYSLYQNDMTESEKFQAQTAIEEKKTRRNNLEQAYSTALDRAVANNAPQSVLNDIDTAMSNPNATQADIYKAMGIYGVDLVEREYKAAQLAQLKANTAKIYADTRNKEAADSAIDKVSSVDPNSPTYLPDIISASKGGELMTGEQSKPISKAMTVVGQLGDIQSTIKSVDTGPILGILKSANPYDEKAQLIKAQLQSLIPGLARGVYGEVGVLTDNDIANYSRTVPNLKSTKDVNDLILLMTLKTVKRSVDDQLEVLASAGRDVSGFKNLYSRLGETVGGLEGKIQGTTAQTGPADDIDSFLDSIK